MVFDSERTDDFRKTHSVGSYPSAFGVLTTISKAREFSVKFTPTLQAAYLDDHDNFKFKDAYLQMDHAEAIENQYINDSASSKNRKTLEIRVDSIEDKIQNDIRSNLNLNRSLRDFVDLFSVRKFNGKQNAEQWIEKFDLECDRFGLIQDKNKIEALRFCIEGTAMDWFEINGPS